MCGGRCLSLGRRKWLIVWGRGCDWEVAGQSGGNEVSMRLPTEELTALAPGHEQGKQVS